MLKRVFVTLMLVCAMAVSFAQKDTLMTGTPVKITDKTWADRGFDFYIGGGMLFGDKFNANYYNGSKLNENNFDYIFRSQHLKNIWNDELINYYRTGIENFDYKDPEDFDWNLHYKLSMMITLGARYKLGKGWAIALSYSFSRLTTSTHLVLSYIGGDMGNQRKLPVVAMVGKEYRSMIDLSASYLFSQVSPIAKPFVELGMQFNYAKVKSFEAALLDENGKMVGSTFSLLNLSGNSSYNQYDQTYDFTFGGPGFGFSGAAGLKFVCGKYVSIDPTFYCYMGRLGIYQGKPSTGHGENKFTFNYGAQIRIVMSDFFFSSRK